MSRPYLYVSPMHRKTGPPRATAGWMLVSYHGRLPQSCCSWDGVLVLMGWEMEIEMGAYGGVIGYGGIKWPGGIGGDGCAECAGGEEGEEGGCETHFGGVLMLFGGDR